MSRSIIQYVTIASLLLFGMTIAIIRTQNHQNLLQGPTRTKFIISLSTSTVETSRQRRLNSPNGAAHISPASVSSNPLPWNTIQANIQTETNTQQTTRTAPSSIQEYLSTMIKGQSQMVLLKWNASGVLENTTGCDKHLDWIKQYYNGDFKYTNPSQYGKVALVFVYDVIEYIPWTVTPPIPVLLYTTLKQQYNTKNYILAPNPYDQSGFSEYQVDLLLEKFKDTMINTTYDTFHSRKNTLMWRGSDHGEPVRASLITIAKEQSTSSTNFWLDAKLSGGNDDSALTEEQLAGSYKYHLDVGGVSGTSWEGLRWKMCSGNLVFHVESGAMDWWHPHIQAGVHYIEVNGDLSNLQSQYNWVESHPQEAYEIAQRGQKVCLQTYRRLYTASIAQSIIHDLPDSSQEQIQEADTILEEYYLDLQSVDKDD